MDLKITKETVVDEAKSFVRGLVSAIVAVLAVVWSFLGDVNTKIDQTIDQVEKVKQTVVERVSEVKQEIDVVVKSIDDTNTATNDTVDAD